jgi:hypothetical protein
MVDEYGVPSPGRGRRRQASCLRDMGDKTHTGPLGAESRDHQKRQGNYFGMSLPCITIK